MAGHPPQQVAARVHVANVCHLRHSKAITMRSLEAFVALCVLLHAKSFRSCKYIPWHCMATWDAVMMSW